MLDLAVDYQCSNGFFQAYVHILRHYCLHLNQLSRARGLTIPVVGAATFLTFFVFFHTRLIRALSRARYNALISLYSALLVKPFSGEVLVCCDLVVSGKGFLNEFHTKLQNYGSFGESLLKLV